MRTETIVSLTTTRNENNQNILDQLLEQLDDIAARVGKDEVISFLEGWMSEPSDRPETELDRQIKERIIEQLQKSEKEGTDER